MAQFSVGFAGTITVEAENAEAAETLVEGAYHLTPIRPGEKPSTKPFIVYALPKPDPAAPKAEVVN